MVYRGEETLKKIEKSIFRRNLKKFSTLTPIFFRKILSAQFIRIILQNFRRVKISPSKNFRAIEINFASRAISLRFLRLLVAFEENDVFAAEIIQKLIRAAKERRKKIIN